MSVASESEHVPKPETRSEGDFPASLFTVAEHVRGALTQLFAAINADPEVPYALSRRLKINKNLAWKICRIINTHDPFSVVGHLPGAQGIEILLAAAAKQGSPANILSDVRDVLAEFERIVETHVGDRRALSLVLASQSATPPELAEEARRMAFVGNSAIWGVQARVRFAAHFVAPAAAGDGTVDAASLGGLTDVRRLRPDVSVPICEMSVHNDDGTRHSHRREPLDPSGGSTASPMMIPAFCSDGAPALRPVQRGNVMRFELPRGPVGLSGLASWVYGWRIARLASIYRDEANEFGEHGTTISVPAETLLCDVQIHRSLPCAQDVQGLLYSELAGPYTGAAQPCDQLPISESLLTLGGSPPVVATPLLPRYSEWVAWTFRQLGWDARDFAAWRFVMKYPPIPTLLVIRYALSQRP